MRSAAVGHQCPDCVKEGNARMRPIKAAYGGRAHGVAAVTYGLIGLNVLMFLVTTGTGTGLLSGGNPSTLFQKLAMSPTYHLVVGSDGLTSVDKGVAQGQYYRLLTATFLHFGLPHLLLNMFSLYLLGPVLEQSFGRLRFGALYLVSGLSGSALSYLLGPTNALAAGASGAIFGLFGGYYVLSRKRGLALDQITATIALNLFISFTVSFIDWRGHVGGLLGGLAVTAALVYAPAGRNRGLAQAVGVVGVLLLAVALVAVRTSQLDVPSTVRFAD